MGMKINKDKTVVMAISRGDVELNVSIEESGLEQVRNFKYLGVTFNEKGGTEGELKERISKFSRNVGMLYPLLGEKSIAREVKVLIYTTILRPILLYGSECWTLNTAQKSKVKAAEMRVMRVIRGVTRRDRLRSEVVRRDLGVEPILE